MRGRGGAGAVGVVAAAAGESGLSGPDLAAVPSRRPDRPGGRRGADGGDHGAVAGTARRFDAVPPGVRRPAAPRTRWALSPQAGEMAGVGIPLFVVDSPSGRPA